MGNLNEIGEISKPQNLRFLYRTMSAQFRIAGTGPIDNRNSKKIYNYNLSHIVSY